MVLGIGCDLADIIKCSKLSSSALKKIYHPNELKEYEKLQNAQDEIKYQFLASRFAVKEAYAKARGLGFCEKIIPNEICTVKDDNGKPGIELYGRTKEQAPKCSVLVTISHTMPLAMAVVVLQD